MTPAERIEIREMRSGEEAACEEILRSLPKWFGIEEAIVSYRADIESMETIVAADANGIAGFLTLKTHNRHAAEVQVMAVRAERHRAGIGRLLMGWAEAALKERGAEYLQVKTLGPSRPNDEYALTRSFYGSLGFLPIEENDLWGESNPCLILVKHLRCSGGGA